MSFYPGLFVQQLLKLQVLATLYLLLFLNLLPNSYEINFDIDNPIGIDEKEFCFALPDLESYEDSFNLSVNNSEYYEDSIPVHVSTMFSYLVSIGVNESKSWHDNSDLTNIEGSQYFLKLVNATFGQASISDISPLFSLTQLILLQLYCAHANCSTYNNIVDLSPLRQMIRLKSSNIYGNLNLYDFSVYYRNISLQTFRLAESGTLEPSNESYDGRLPICRSESNTEYMAYLTDIFPNLPATFAFILPNICPLAGMVDDHCTGSDCPSILLNEVYNPESEGIECSYISKMVYSSESDFNCHTIHDNSLRNYLSSSCSCVAESNGVIPVSTLRKCTGCSGSIDISSISGDIHSIRGLEYFSHITSLNISSFDLSGANRGFDYDDEIPFHERMTVKILTRHSVDDDSNVYGVTNLNVSGCNLRKIEDILDFTPRTDVSVDPYTKDFQITSLDLSNNRISDVSMLLTDTIFTNNNSLMSLNISNNYICDIENIETLLLSEFPGLSLNIDDQQCMCSSPVDSSSFEVCREVTPGQWAKECFKGYYLQLDTNTCVQATSETNIFRTQVCEKHDTMMAVATDSSSTVTCRCRTSWWGDKCENLVDVFFPSIFLRGCMCYSYSSEGVEDCNMSKEELALYKVNVIETSLLIDTIEGYEGLHSVSAVKIGGMAYPDLSPLQNLSQLVLLSIKNPNPSYWPDVIDDLSPLNSLTRLRNIDLGGNEPINDISPIFHNIGLESFKTSEMAYNVAISMCRSETNAEFGTIWGLMFPEYSTNSSDLSLDIYPNSCPLDSSSDFCSSAGCPSFAKNEIYSSVLGKQCASIAKTDISSGDLICYTIHDDNLRSMIFDCTEYDSTLMLPVYILRSALTCNSLNVQPTELTPITSLRGLEYAQGVGSGLSSLIVEDYDLSGDSDASSFDQFLSLVNCGINNVYDILDLTPIISDSDENAPDTVSQPFNLTTLDLSHNNISDISMFLTRSDLFSSSTSFSDVLNIGHNQICDIVSVASSLASYFSIGNFSFGNQTCLCSSVPSFAQHFVCTNSEIGYIHTCAYGYFLKLETNTCEQINTNYLPIYSSICSPDYPLVLEPGATSYSCSCPRGLYGSDCEYVYIPNVTLKEAICSSINGGTVEPCDDVLRSDMKLMTSLSISGMDGSNNSFYGLNFATALTQLEVTNSTFEIDSSHLLMFPQLIEKLYITSGDLASDTDFSRFEDLYFLDISYNINYRLSDISTLPETLTILVLAGNTSMDFSEVDLSSLHNLTYLDVSSTLFASFSIVPSTVTTLIADNCTELWDIPSTGFADVSSQIEVLSLV
ncbi:hypothetical protein ADUPG1_008692, partial [Aduncisulcus paluster]